MSRARTSVFVGSLLQVGLVDLSCALPVAAVWVWIGVTGILPVLVLMLLRCAGWCVHLYGLLAPIDRWQEADEAEQAKTAAAVDTATRHCSRRFAATYALGWIATFAAGVAIELVGIEAPLPAADLIAASGVLLALVLACPANVGAVINHRLGQVRGQLNAVLMDQGLESRAVPGSLRARAVVLTTSSVVATLLGVGALTGLLGIRMLRQHDAIEQRHLAELDAALLGLDAARLGLDAARLGLDAALLGREGAGVDIEGVVVETARLPVAPEPGASTVEAFDVTRARVVGAAALGDGRWVVHEAAVDEPLVLWTVVLLLLGVAAAIPSGLAGYTFGGSIATPIEQLSEATRTFVEDGQLRAFVRVAPLANDELGQFTRNFNAMLDVLGDLARAAEAVADGDLSVELSRRGELQDAFRGMLDRLRTTVTRLRETVLELASAAAEIHAITTRQDDVAGQQAETVLEVSETVASLAISAQEIADTARGALTDAEQAVATTHVMAERIGELRGQTASIAELLLAIREIAARSDLLALNGSLEATRAGEAGRGFALVAAEMRRLAERVTAVVDDVSVKLGEVEASGVSTVMATEESRKLAERAAEAARAISSVTQQQSSGTDRVSHGVLAVADMVSVVAGAVGEARSAAAGLRAHAAELERLTEHFEL